MISKLLRSGFKIAKISKKWVKNYLKENCQECIKKNDKKFIKKVKQIKFEKKIGEIILKVKVWEFANEQKRKVSCLKKFHVYRIYI